MKKIFNSLNHTSWSSGILLDFFIAQIHLKNKNFDYFLKYNDLFMKKLEDEKELSNLITRNEYDVTVISMIKNLLVKEIEQFLSNSCYKSEFFDILKPLTEIENYKNLFFKSKHNILMTYLIVDYVIFLKNFNMVQDKEKTNLFSFIYFITKENLCTICIINEENSSICGNY
jgi:hypothetical protein